MPLIGVAVGGVLVVKAAAGIEGAPQALAGARAWAEDLASPKQSKAAATALKADESLRVAALAKPPSPAPAWPAAPKPAPLACAPSAADLARAANLSPAELQLLQSLSTRRGQLDQREKDINTQLQLLTAAGAKLDAKLRAMQTVKGEITGLLGQVDQKQEAEVARLVSVYEKMKPRDAAAVMATLDDKVRVPVAGKMSDRALAALMAAAAAGRGQAPDRAAGPPLRRRLGHGQRHRQPAAARAPTPWRPTTSPPPSRRPPSPRRAARTPAPP